MSRKARAQRSEPAVTLVFDLDRTNQAGTHLLGTGAVRGTMRMVRASPSTSPRAHVTSRATPGRRNHARRTTVKPFAMYFDVHELDATTRFSGRSVPRPVQEHVADSWTSPARGDALRRRPASVTVGPSGRTQHRETPCGVR